MGWGAGVRQAWCGCDAGAEHLGWLRAAIKGSLQAPYFVYCVQARCFQVSRAVSPSQIDECPFYNDPSGRLRAAAG
jgi:hypothetical protein